MKVAGGGGGGEKQSVCTGREMLPAPAQCWANVGPALSRRPSAFLVLFRGGYPPVST